MCEEKNGPERVGDCGCVLKRTDKGLSMVNCPLHADSPDLLAALEDVTSSLAGWMEIADDEDVRAYDIEALRRATALLIKHGRMTEGDWLTMNGRASSSLVARYKGYRAYMYGVVVGDNPYKEQDKRFWHWMAGWTQAGMNRVKRKVG